MFICLYLLPYCKIIVKKDHLFLILLFPEDHHKEIELDEFLNLSVPLHQDFCLR